MTIPGRLSGERFQAALGGKPIVIPTWIKDMAGGLGASIMKVKSVDYAGARVEVGNSNGTNWAFVLKAKSSRGLAGSIDMPNPGDLGVVLSINGDSKSNVWIGAINTIETSENLEKSSFFPNVSDLVHVLFRKHESESFWLLNKLGNLSALFTRKAETESDEARKHIGVSFGNDGKVTLTHYRDADNKGAEFTLSEDGEFSYEVLKDDGSTVSQRFSASSKDGAESFKFENLTAGSSIEAKPNGDVDVSAPVVNVVSPSVNLGTIGLQEFVTKTFLTLFYNVMIPLLKSHTHVVVNAVPAAPGPVVASPSLELIPVTTTPTTTPNITGQVKGG